MTLICASYFNSSHSPTNVSVCTPAKITPRGHHAGCRSYSWWRQSNGNISTLLAICAGISPVTGEFPAQSPVTRSFGVFFDLRRNKRLSKQWWGWWFETPSRPLWRHSFAAVNEGVIICNHGDPYVNCVMTTLVMPNHDADHVYRESRLTAMLERYNQGPDSI